MSVITAGQSLVDVALQELGSVAALFDLADANGLAITDALAAGQVLAVPDSLAARPELLAYFQSRAYRVNTGANPEAATMPPPVVDWRPTDFDSTDYLTV